MQGKQGRIYGHFTLLVTYTSGYFIPKTDVFRTANIAKSLVETTAPSRCKFGVKVLMGFRKYAVSEETGICSSNVIGAPDVSFDGS